MERAAGQRGQALLDQRAAGSRRRGRSRRRTRRRGRGRRRCRARRTGRGRRCRCTGSRPCRASRRPRPRCRGRRRTRCRRARPTGREVRTLLTRSLSVGVGLRVGRGCSASARSRRATSSPPCGSRVDHQDGVVAGDGAEDVGVLGLVERRGEELGGAGRGAQHDEVGAGVGADEELGAAAGPAGGRRRRSPPAPPVAGRRPRRVRRTRGRRTGERTRTASSSTRSRDRVRLGDVHAASRRAGRRARPASAPRGRRRRSTISWCRAFLVAGRRAALVMRLVLAAPGAR